MYDGIKVLEIVSIARQRQDLESANRELVKLKDRHLEQAVKYSRALEEQGKASIRERDLLRQVGCLATPRARTLSVHSSYTEKSSSVNIFKW